MTHSANPNAAAKPITNILSTENFSDIHLYNLLTETSPISHHYHYHHHHQHEASGPSSTPGGTMPPPAATDRACRIISIAVSPSTVIHATTPRRTQTVIQGPTVREHTTTVETRARRAGALFAVSDPNSGLQICGVDVWCISLFVKLYQTILTDCCKSTRLLHNWRILSRVTQTLHPFHILYDPPLRNATRQTQHHTRKPTSCLGRLCQYTRQGKCIYRRLRPRVSLGLRVFYLFPKVQRETVYSRLSRNNRGGLADYESML